MGNVRFVIHTNDHPPAHVHAISPNGEAKIEIESLECFYCRGFTERDLKMLVQLVAKKKAILMEAWDEFHS